MCNFKMINIVKKRYRAQLIFCNITYTIDNLIMLISKNSFSATYLKFLTMASKYSDETVNLQLQYVPVMTIFPLPS